MKYKPDHPSRKQFLADVREHEIKIIREDGIDRHLRFKKPDTGIMLFDLVTWPGYLCYTGDMGSYLFRRVEDMFTFFRPHDDQLRISESYWAQKVEAMDRADQIKRYSPDKFREQVKWWTKNAEMPKGKRRIVREALEANVLSYADDGEYAAMKAAMEFSCEGFRLYDFWEADCTEYTYRFIWACYAIVWGIQQYDRMEAQKAA